jgi:voltage-gated potassium channel
MGLVPAQDEAGTDALVRAANQLDAGQERDPGRHHDPSGPAREVPARRSPTGPERMASLLEERLDGPVAALGVVFVLVVLADNVVEPRGTLAVALTVAGWVLWGVFALEFALRMVVAPSTWGFLRRNWWQLVFLVLPFLRFARVLARLRLARVGRVGRVVSSAVRGTRSAALTLSSRIAWLGAATIIVILAASQVLYEAGAFETYGEALHAAALATITGEPLGRDGAAARLADVVLSLYSVVVFATLAGMLGAFFLERGEPGATEPVPTTTAEERRTDGR